MSAPYQRPANTGGSAQRNRAGALQTAVGTFLTLLALAGNGCGSDGNGMIPTPVPTVQPGANTTGGATTGGGAPTIVPLGDWGGRGIKLTVTNTGGLVDYHCGAGTITQPMVLSSTGHFDVTGTTLNLYPVGGRPPFSTHYMGVVVGNTMTLMEATTDYDGSVSNQTFSLNYGQGTDPGLGSSCPHRSRG